MLEKPLTEIAAVTDETPGIGVTFNLFFIHSFRIIFPGSEIIGVPASDIRDIIFPDFISLIIFSTLLFSLNL